MELTPTRLKCLLIADDLTGACDSAVHFARAGYRTIALPQFDEIPADAQVAAISTESRDIPGEHARERLREVAESLTQVASDILFKKIDSTLRGNTAIELAASLEAFGCEAAVINPAFPAMGRLVEDGFLRVSGDSEFVPVEIARWLRDYGAGRCRHVSAGGIAEAIADGVQFVSLDARCQDDLARMAAEIRSLPHRILWAGSGGLAAALAGLPGTPPSTGQALPDRAGAVLFCLGSNHPVTIAQERQLLEGARAVLVNAETARRQEVSEAIGGGSPVVLRISRSQTSAARLSALISGCAPAAMVFSGGDTASLVCRALSASAIQLQDELAPGIPAGRLCGGRWDGAIVATKSGGFGGPDDLLAIAQRFGRLD